MTSSQAIASQLMSDPAIMTLITSLQQDPQVQAVISDPEIRRAVQAGDLDALMSHPGFAALMRNATVRKITRQVQ